MAGKSGRTDPALDRAEQALIRIERVLEQLLLLARTEVTGAGPAVTQVDIATVASKISAELLPKAPCKGVDLGYEGPLTPHALSVETLLGELIRNLVDNAILHGPPAALITVRVRIEEPGRIGLTILNSGPPVPDSLLVQLRERVQPASDKGIRTGTRGMGLYIVAEIAEALKADLRLDRGETGGGLNWHISVPPTL